MTDHARDSINDRCTCGGEIVYFEDGDDDGQIGEGCEVGGHVFVDAPACDVCAGTGEVQVPGMGTAPCPYCDPKAARVDASEAEGPAADLTPAQRYGIPAPTCKLVGEDGNAMNVIARGRRALQRAGYPPEALQAYIVESKSGDYNTVLATAMKWLEVE